MSTVWNTSDHHFGHKLVAKHRGFWHEEDGEVVVETDAHDSEIVRRHNEVVRPDDIVWFHGDLCLKDVDYALELVGRMNGRRHLIWGNHDAGWPGHSDSHKNQARYLEVFDSVQFAKVRKFGKLRVMMTHLPYVGDHTPTERYPEWRLANTMPLLCGHVHDKWKTRGNQLNVGLDVWGLAPVPLKEITNWLATLGMPA